MTDHAKEAIEDLEKALKIKEQISPDYTEETIKYAADLMMVHIEDALAKLRTAQEPTEQPPAEEYPNSEFIKVQRVAAQYAIEAYEQDEEWCPTKMTRLLEACDRLETETQEKRLWKIRVDEAAEYIKDYEDLKAKLDTEIKKNFESERYPIGSMSAMRKEISQLEAKLKAKDELLFAYESVKAPVNPLLSINKDLRIALEEAKSDFYYIHQHPEDAHVDSYNFMEKAKAAMAKQS